MEYNINFKVKGDGSKQAKGLGSLPASLRGARQQAIEASKKQAQAGGADGKQFAQAVTLLNTSIKDLNKNILQLTSAIRAKGINGGSGGGAGGINDGLGGLGNVGSSIPIVGAIIAGLGFVANKAYQIGQTYMQRRAEELPTAGVAGFRLGQRKGNYLSAQVGEGIKAYRLSSGEWKGDVDNKAWNIASVYGMGAGEFGTQAGAFTRMGQSYTGTAETASKLGLMSEMPTLLSVVAGQLEDAVREGVNSSHLSKDMGEEFALLVSKTGSRSSAAAMGILSKINNGATGSGLSINSGLDMFRQMGYRTALLDQMNSAGGLQKLVEQNYISEETAKGIRAKANSEKISLQNLMDVLGGADLYSLQTAYGATLSSTKKSNYTLRSFTDDYLQKAGVDITDADSVDNFLRKSPEQVRKMHTIYESMANTGLTSHNFRSALSAAYSATKKGGKATVLDNAIQATKSAGNEAKLGIKAGQDKLLGEQHNLAEVAQQIDNLMLDIASSASNAVQEINNTLKSAGFGNENVSMSDAMGNLMKQVGDKIGNAIIDTIQKNLPAPIQRFFSVGTAGNNK